MRYNIHIPTTTLEVVNQDIITIVSGSKRSVLVCEIDLFGAELSGSVSDLGFYLCTNPGVTGGGAIIPQPIGNPNLTGSGAAIAFSGNVYTTWGTQPAVVSDTVHATPLNANGQRYYWATENIDDMISIPGGGGAAGTLSLRTIVGVSHIGGRIKIIEP